MAIKSMPWTYRSAILMGLVQFAWCIVAAIAALGSFIALETVTAPDGSSHRAIYCLENFDFESLGEETSQQAAASCTCSGVKISDVSGGGCLRVSVWVLCVCLRTCAYVCVRAVCVGGCVVLRRCSRCCRGYLCTWYSTGFAILSTVLGRGKTGAPWDCALFFLFGVL